MRRAILLAGLLLAACAGGPPPEPVPDRPTIGAGDPAHQAVLVAAYAFGDTRRLAGRPADAARAAAAVALPQDFRWTGASPLLFGQLRDARAELRGVLGIAPDASPVAVSQRLRAAARLLDEGSRAEAAAALGGEAALDRLGALPRLPRTAAATGLAQSELGRLMQEDPTG
jgi:hypothetical protein